MLLNISLPIERVFLIAKISSVFFNLTFLFGLFGNSMIVISTIKCKTLHNPCNVLIACQAVSDLLLGVGHPAYAYYAYWETLISFADCYFVQLISFSAVNTSTIMILIVGIDRVVAVKFVLFYKNKNSYVYVCSLIAGALVYCTALNVFAYFTRSDQLTMCLVPEAYAALSKEVAFGSHFAINVLAVLCYIHLNSMLTSINNVQIFRMIKSLRTVVFCTVFGWFITFVICNTAMLMSSDENWLLAADMIAGFFACTHVAIPFVVYYMKSSVYRTAFRSIVNAKVGFECSL